MTLMIGFVLRMEDELRLAEEGARSASANSPERLPCFSAAA